MGTLAGSNRVGDCDVAPCSAWLDPSLRLEALDLCHRMITTSMTRATRTAAAIFLAIHEFQRAFHASQSLQN
jgi:hypothetical protein